jgi:hypothetical protein
MFFNEKKIDYDDLYYSLLQWKGVSLVKFISFIKWSFYMD